MSAKSVTSEKVMREEAALAFADPRKLVDGEGRPLPLCDLPARTARALATVEVVEREDKSGVVTRTWKYRLLDKGRALKRLENLLGMGPEDAGNDGSAVVVNLRMDLGGRP